MEKLSKMTKKLVRINNLQKAFEDYDRIKGSPVESVEENLPEEVQDRIYMVKKSDESEALSPLATMKSISTEVYLCTGEKVRIAYQTYTKWQGKEDLTEVEFFTSQLSPVTREFTYENEDGDEVTEEYTFNIIFKWKEGTLSVEKLVTDESGAVKVEEVLVSDDVRCIDTITDIETEGETGIFAKDIELATLAKVKEMVKGGGSGTGNYEELENKPKINGIELEGDMSLEDLNIHKIDDEQIKDLFKE